MRSENRLCEARVAGSIRTRRVAIMMGAIALGTIHVNSTAGTFRFDHVELESFKGGSTSAHALSNAGLVVGASGGIGVNSHNAFISDQSGALQGIKGLALHHSIALVVNDKGQLAGRGCTGDELCIDAAFRASAGLGVQIIAGLPGKIGEVTDINENGDVVGSWIPDPHEFSVRAFLYSDGGGLQELGHLGGGWSSASAVSDLQQVVGTSRYGALPSQTHAFLWEAAPPFVAPGMTDLGVGPFGGVRSEAYDINNAGTIVGAALDKNFASHAFVWTKAGGMQPLALPKDAFHSAALQINEAGMMLAGYTRSDDSSGMVVVYPDNTFAEIPLLEGFQTGSALAMNNLGHVVGGNVLVQGSEEIVVAFYWSLETGTIYLDGHIVSDMPWTIFSPVAINDNDEIIVRAFDDSGENAALLRPALDGDVNGDRIVNVDDLLGVINAWGECEGEFCASDFDHSGTIDVDDLLSVINHWS